MSWRTQGMAALVAVLLVTLGPLAVGAQKITYKSICSSRTGACSPMSLADGYDSLMQESMVTSRSYGQSLVQESFHLHGPNEDGAKAPAAAAQEARRPPRPHAQAATSAPETAGPQPRPLPPPTESKPSLVAAQRGRRPDRKTGRKEEALEVEAGREEEASEAAASGASAPPPTANAAAAKLRPRAFDAERASAALQEPRLSQSEPLPPPPAGRKRQATLQAEAAPSHPGTAAAAATVAAPPLKNATGASRRGVSGSDLHSWGSVLRAPMLVVCVTCVLRALVCRIALPWRKSGVPSGAPPAAGGGGGRARAHSGGGPALCPELVVPEGKECKLLVPRLPLGGGQVSVCDQQGLPVLRASCARLSCAGGRVPRPKEARRLQLTSATGETVFASCRDAEVQPGGGRPVRLALHHRSEELFGSLGADGYQAGSGYSVIDQKGCAIYFRAGPKAGVMNATDDSGRLLAVIEPSGPSQSLLRIGQLVDAGLIALTAMGIDILEQGGAGSKGDADLL